MRNLNAILKLQAYEQNKSIKHIAHLTNLDEAYISRVFNKKIKIRKKRNIEKLCKILNVDGTKNCIEEKSYMELVNRFLEDAFKMDAQLELSYMRILSLENESKSTPFYIQILLVKFIYAVYMHKSDISIDRIVGKLLHIEKSLEDRDRTIFLIFYMNHLKNQHKYSDIYDIIREIELIKYKNSILNLMYYYYLTAFYAGTKSIEFYEYYEKCRDLCIDVNNIKRVINLQMICSNFLRQLGYIEKSLQTDLNTLDEMENSNYILNKPLVLNNIAWTYLLLNRYEESIEYYLKTIKLFEDNDIYFNLAWCYYCTKNKKKALEYIQIGMTSKSRYDYYYLLLEWLEKMINRKYSKRSLKLLLDVLAYHSDAVPKKMKEFVYNQIIDYYKYHKDFALALYYSDELNDIVYEQETEKQ